jgi:hypothetical protein
MSITVSPYTTTNTTGTFGVSSQGYIQGTAEDDPVTRYALSGGIVNSSETYPMWGGIAITESISSTPTTAAGLMGSTIARAATTGANIQGFTVSDQGYNGIITTSSKVPLYVQGGSVHFYRLGSRARLRLKIDDTFAATLLGGLTSATCYWDFTNQQLLGTGTGALSVKILDVQIGNSKTISYNTSTGIASFSDTGSVAVVLI